VEKKKIESFRGKLLKEKGRLEGELKPIHDENFETAQAQRDSGSDNNYQDHMGDAATDIFDRERDLSLEENLDDLLKQVDSALERLDSGSFGQCIRCGKKIDEARLRAIPYAGLCIECKKEEERDW